VRKIVCAFFDLRDFRF